MFDDVAKYNESEKSNEGFTTPPKKIHSKDRVVRTPEIIQWAQGLIFADSAIVFGMSEKTWRRIVEEVLRYKSYTNKVRQILSEAARTTSYNVDMFWSKEFCPPNSPDLNPLDF